MFRLRKTKRTVKNSAKEILSTAKFIPRSDVEITLEDIPEELRLEQRPDIVDKIIKQEFRWSPINGALGYEIALKNLNTGEWQYIRNIKGTSFQSKKIMREGKYLWKVRASCGKFSEWSLPAKFIVDDNGSSRNIGLEFNRNVLLKKREMSKKKVNLDSKPFQLGTILLDRRCNLSCVYCGVKSISVKKLRLHPKLFEDLAVYLPFARTVSFGGTDPMLYPEFRQICDLVEAYPEVGMSICTNGMLIDEYWAKRFSKGNFPWLRISIDGATPETYTTVRKGGDLQRILHGIDLVNRFRGERGTPKLQWNFCVNALNFHEMVQFVELAYRYNVDVVNFQGLIVYNELDGELLKIVPPKETHREILQLLIEAESRADKYGIRIIDQVRGRGIVHYTPRESIPRGSGPIESQTTIGLETRGDTEVVACTEVTPQTFKQSGKASGFFCHAPFTTLSFGAGIARFCCYAKIEFLLIPYEDDCKSINGIWNSPKFRGVRRLMYENPKKAREVICRPICPFYESGLRSIFLR